MRKVLMVILAGMVLGQGGLALANPHTELYTLTCPDGGQKTLEVVCHKDGEQVQIRAQCPGSDEFLVRYQCKVEPEVPAPIDNKSEFWRYLKVGARFSGGALYTPRLEEQYSKGVAVFGQAWLTVRFPELITPWWGVEFSGSIGPAWFPSRPTASYRLLASELASVWKIGESNEVSVAYRFMSMSDADEDLSQMHFGRIGLDHFITSKLQIGLSVLLGGATWVKKENITDEDKTSVITRHVVTDVTRFTWSGELRFTWWFW